MPRNHGTGELNSDQLYAQGKRGCAKRPGRPGATSLVVQQVFNERLLRVRDACILHRRLRVDAVGDGHLLQIADGHLLEDSLIIGRQS